MCQARAGGITAGQHDPNDLVENCYNFGNVETYGCYSFAGGIIGVQDIRVNDNIPQIINCYSSAIINAVTGKYKYSGGILGSNGQNNSIHYGGDIINSFCSNEKQAYYNLMKNLVYEGCIEKSTLKTYASQLGEAFINDDNNINDGYPILKWQVKKTFNEN